MRSCATWIRGSKATPMIRQGASAMSTTRSILPVSTHTFAWESPRPRGKGNSFPSSRFTCTCHSTPTVSTPSAMESTSITTSGKSDPKGLSLKSLLLTNAGWNRSALTNASRPRHTVEGPRRRSSYTQSSVRKLATRSASRALNALYRPLIAWAGVSTASGAAPGACFETCASSNSMRPGPPLGSSVVNSANLERKPEALGATPSSRAASAGASMVMARARAARLEGKRAMSGVLGEWPGRREGS
mmetsp:Transcript_17316/g.43521  ORF Transcript_17316/g.43521 Transcript_17316/m.43521 type:complete len:245 (+) Transcript_17316:613-1347(+)